MFSFAFPHNVTRRTWLVSYYIVVVQGWGVILGYSCSIVTYNKGDWMYISGSVCIVYHPLLWQCSHVNVPVHFEGGDPPEGIKNAQGTLTQKVPSLRVQDPAKSEMAVFLHQRHQNKTCFCGILFLAEIYLLRPILKNLHISKQVPEGWPFGGGGLSGNVPEGGAGSFGKCSWINIPGGDCPPLTEYILDRNKPG